MIKPFVSVFMLLLLSSVTVLGTNLHTRSQFKLKSENSVEQDALEIQQVFRWYFPGKGYHFYTLDPYGGGAVPVGFVYEGVEFCTLKQPTAGADPLYQIFIYGSHVYTTSLVEAQQPNAMQAGDIGYVFSDKRSSIVRDPYGNVKIEETVPLYRWYQPNTGDHFYFVDPSFEAHLALGYQFDLIQAYVFPCKQGIINVSPSNFRAIKKSEVGAGDLKLNDGFDSSDIAFYTLNTQVDGSAKFAASGNDIGFIFTSPVVVTLRDNSGNFLVNLKTVALHEWHSRIASEKSIYSTSQDVWSQIPVRYWYKGIVGYVLPRTFMNKLATYT